MNICWIRKYTIEVADALCHSLMHWKWAQTMPKRDLGMEVSVDSQPLVHPSELPQYLLVGDLPCDFPIPTPVLG